MKNKIYLVLALCLGSSAYTKGDESAKDWKAFIKRFAVIPEKGQNTNITSLVFSHKKSFLGAAPLSFSSTEGAFLVSFPWPLLSNLQIEDINAKGMGTIIGNLKQFPVLSSLTLLCAQCKPDENNKFALALFDATRAHPLKFITLVTDQNKNNAIKQYMTAVIDQRKNDLIAKENPSSLPKGIKINPAPKTSSTKIDELRPPSAVVIPPEVNQLESDLQKFLETLQ